MQGKQTKTLVQGGKSAWHVHSQAWTHKLAHMHKKTIQTSRERAVTNRSKVDKDSVSQLLIVFFWSKRKRKRIKTKCEDHRKKQVKLNDSAEHKKRMHKQMTTQQPCTIAMNLKRLKKPIGTTYNNQKQIRTSYLLLLTGQRSVRPSKSVQFSVFGIQKQCV